jgi:glycosyltransferase involved in cell wall biosynthesis
MPESLPHSNGARGRKTRVLYVTSNHAAIRPGGLETYTQDLYEAMRESDDFEPILIARAGPPFTHETCFHGWSAFALVGEDPNQYLIYTNTFAPHSQFDPLFGRWTNKQVLTRFFAEFLLAQRPDIVHVQHSIFLGYDLLRIIRTTLPDAPIVYTLHDYLPICHRDGQMVRTRTENLCLDESPRRCNECFPEISPQTFFSRKRFIQSHFALVDQFIAPTQYVHDRYVDWGVPDERIIIEPQGMVPAQDCQADVAEERPRNRFAYFGQLNPYKGADVLLEAMEILNGHFDGHLWIHGANLEIQPIEFRERIASLTDGSRRNITFVGPYQRLELGKLMASIDWVVVPSIWWETGPIVVMEAFQYGRPVICSDIGGMAEKVGDGVNGLHFRRRDAEDLAETMLRAAETPGLWEKLRSGIPADPSRSIDEHVEILRSLYRGLLSGERTLIENLATTEAAGA